jgi:hypothetical protein
VGAAASNADGVAVRLVHGRRAAGVVLASGSRRRCLRLVLRARTGPNRPIARERKPARRLRSSSATGARILTGTGGSHSAMTR